MDDSLEVETERVEKLTRTSSLQQVGIEDIGLKSDPLDETELYDVAEYDNLKKTDIVENGSISHHQSINVSNGLDAFDGVNVSLPSEVNSSIEDHNLGGNLTSDVSLDSNPLQAKIGLEFDHSSDGNQKDDALANVSVTDNNTNAAGVLSATSLQEDIAPKSRSEGGIQQLQKLNHNCCETVKDSISSERAQSVNDNLTEDKTHTDSVSDSEPAEFNSSINGDGSCLQNVVEQEFNVREVNVPTDNDDAGNDFTAGSVDSEADESQHNGSTVTATDVSVEAVHSWGLNGHTAAGAIINDNRMLSDDTAAATDNAQDAKQCMEALCSSIKEPEEPDHQTRCELLSHEHISENNSNSAPAEPCDAGRMHINKESWLYLLGHDKLKKRILKPGEEGKRADFGYLVTVRCCGRLDSGVEVDRYDKLQLVVGDGDFIQAFDIAIPHMDRGEVCELVTDAVYAYGTLGRKPDVPADATITYEIELCNFEEQPDYSKLLISERLQLSNAKRERGNHLYSRNECSRAIEAYAKALKIIGDSSESLSGDSRELQLLLDARVKCFNNLAAAQLKIEEWDAALQSINYVLRTQPTNVKALFRKAKCLSGKGDYDAAIAVLRRAAKLEPETKVIQQELSQLEKRNESQKKSQKAMYEKMMGFGKKPVNKSKEESSKSWWWAGLAATVVAVSASIAMYRRFQHG